MHSSDTTVLIVKYNFFCVLSLSLPVGMGKVFFNRIIDVHLHSNDFCFLFSNHLTKFTLQKFCMKCVTGKYVSGINYHPQQPKHVCNK